MSQLIPLPFVAIPLTMNQAHRMHHMAVGKIRKVIRATTVTSCHRAKAQPMAGAEVVLHYRPGTRRRFDSDALDATKKPVIDGLVDAGVLPEDWWGVVPFSGCYVHPPQRGVGASMWITLEEVYK